LTIGHLADAAFATGLDYPYYCGKSRPLDIALPWFANNFEIVFAGSGWGVVIHNEMAYDKNCIRLTG